MAKQRKLFDGCKGCRAMRMRPVKAWAVIRGNRLQGQASDNLDVILVMPNKATALKYCQVDGDQVARVEIREVF